MQGQKREGGILANTVEIKQSNLQVATDVKQYNPRVEKIIVPY